MQSISLSGSTLTYGVLPSDPVVTRDGFITVHAFGFVLNSRWGVIKWLQPIRVDMHRANGNHERQTVRNTTQRVVIILISVGAVVSWISNKFRNRLRA